VGGGVGWGAWYVHSLILCFFVTGFKTLLFISHVKNIKIYKQNDQFDHGFEPMNIDNKIYVFCISKL